MGSLKTEDIKTDKAPNRLPIFDEYHKGRPAIGKRTSIITRGSQTEPEGA